ncbi:MAG: hypothetical protein RL324_2364 [Verrucomicrobiota bacterium]|jgi:porin
MKIRALVLAAAGKLSPALVVVSLGLVAPALRAAETAPDYAQERISGGWSGARSSLDAKGYTFEGVTKIDGWREPSGGTAGSWRGLGNLDLQLGIDAEKAFGWKDTTLFVYGLGDAGGRPNELPGSLAGIDNIEVGTPAFRLYEAWIERNFAAGRVSVLAGLHDLNSEFYVTDASGLFLGPTFGIGTEMSATGQTGPSIFPSTSLALRVRVEPWDGVFLQTAAYDGAPGDPNNPRGTHLTLGAGEGTLYVAEAGWQSEGTHLGVGGWRYSAKFPDVLTGAPADSRGAYLLAEHKVGVGALGDIAFFGRYGWTAADAEDFRSSWSAGAVWSGLLHSHPESSLGLAVAQAELSNKFLAANGPLARRETQVELTWEEPLGQGITIQPDLQLIHSPGGAIGATDAWTGGIRLKLEF